MFSPERQILESRIATYAANPSSTIDVSYENVDYKPTPGSSYLDTMIIGNAIPRYSTLGNVKWIRCQKIFQVNINIPQSQGAKPAETIADALAPLFRGQVQDGSLTVTFYPAGLKPVGNRNGFYTSILSIPYQVDYPEV